MPPKRARRQPKPADLTVNVLPQEQSPFCRLPLEIRHMIYELALTPQQVTDGGFVKGIEERDLMDISGDDDSAPHTHRHGEHHHALLPNWFRPGCTGRTKIHTELLRTCKLIYAEAASVPVANTVHKCYQGYGPRGSPSPSAYFQRFTKSQLSDVRQVQIFTQVSEFDADGFWMRNELAPVSKNLQHLTITLRDLGGAPDKPLLVNPFREGEATREAMDEDMKKTTQPRGKGKGKATDRQMPTAGWAGTFADLPALKTLTLEVEDQESKEDNLNSVVNWAKKWTFPLDKNGNYLISKTAPSRRIWRRPTRHRHCLRHSHQYTPPRIITWSIRWDAPAVRKVSSPNGKKIKNKQESPKQAASHKKAGEQSNVQTRAARANAPPRFERPAYDPCLGGLNSIWAHAPDEALQELIDYGIL